MRVTRLLPLLAALAAALPSAAGSRIDLNGLWDFRLHEGKSMEDVDVRKAGTNARMPVPGCWDAFSRWYGRRGTGFYRRELTLDADVDQAFLVIDGCGVRSRYWIDGKDVGRSVMPWIRLEFPLGSLKAGRHVIEAAVDSLIDNTKVKLFWDFYDFYAYGGFHHGVFIETANGADALRRVIVRTRDYRTGLVELEAVYAREGPADFTAAVAFDDGEPFTIAFRNRRAQVRVPRFRLWTPDAPRLHTVTVTPQGTRSSGGSQTARFGIRQVGTDKGRITLNGEPIYLKGVNRHESHPEFGVTTPRQLMIEDVQNVKDLGGNFIRGSHYPQCEAFLDLCDELGVLVWEESLGWGNGPRQLNDPEFRALQEEETRLTVRNSINHPSVIISGFLNEPHSDRPECKSLVERLIEVVRAEDSGHLVTFACCRTDKDISHAKTDIICYNTYPCWYNDLLVTGSVEEVRANIRGCHERIVRYFRDLYHDDRPILVSETGVKADYGVHDPRGRAQYTEDFQAEYTRIMLEEVFTNREIAGIAIWQYCDCKTYTRTQSMRGRSYGINTGGLFDSYRRPKMAVEEVRRLFTRKAAGATAAELGERYWRTKSEDDRLAWVTALDGEGHDFSKRYTPDYGPRGIYKFNRDARLACFVITRDIAERLGSDTIDLDTPEGPIHFVWKRGADGAVEYTQSAPTNWDVFVTAYRAPKKGNPKPEANISFKTGFPRLGPLSLTIMHHRPDWVAGPYANYPFPSNEVAAANNFVFAAREALVRLGFGRKEALDGTIWLGTFDSNFPKGHTDFPPHFHIIPHTRDGQQVHHFYIRREDGRITSDCYQDMSRVIDTWDRAVTFRPGDEFPCYDGGGRVAFRVKMLADGTGLELASSDRERCLRIASARPCDSVDVLERTGDGWRTVSTVRVTDDSLAGVMETPDGTVRYDPATGRRKD